MFDIQGILVSLDVITQCFGCDIDRCKGLCCVEGDAGAPVTDTEEDEIKKHLPFLLNHMMPQARQVVEELGLTYIDPMGEKVLYDVNKRDCVFAKKNVKNGIYYCILQKLFNEGQIPFDKPISCRLYPLREVKIQAKNTIKTGLEYNRWDVCYNRCKRNNNDKTKLYEFLEEPLVKRFGQDWYDELKLTASEWTKQYNHV